jgi:methylase of polypeptide subunit release factors
MTQVVANRRDWLQRISELTDDANRHDEEYSTTINNFTVYIHPSVFSPKYFKETQWYAENLPAIVNEKSFLEVGVGSGLVSLSVAASGSSRVLGIDINPEAVKVAQKNFEANGIKNGTFLVSDIYETVTGRFDFIFWNHPWQNSLANITDQLKCEHTFDADYRHLTTYIVEAKDYLTPGGRILLGTSAFADREAMDRIFVEHGYMRKTLRSGKRDIGKGVFEEYYIIEVAKM